MTLRIHFTADDLARTRLVAGPDPMWELVLSLAQLQAGRSAGAVPAHHRPWLERARLRLAGLPAGRAPVLPAGAPAAGAPAARLGGRGAARSASTSVSTSVSVSVAVPVAARGEGGAGGGGSVPPRLPGGGAPVGAVARGGGGARDGRGRDGHGPTAGAAAGRRVDEDGRPAPGAGADGRTGDGDDSGGDGRPARQGPAGSAESAGGGTADGAGRAAEVPVGCSPGRGGSRDDGAGRRDAGAGGAGAGAGGAGAGGAGAGAGADNTGADGADVRRCGGGAGSGAGGGSSAGRGRSGGGTRSGGSGNSGDGGNVGGGEPPRERPARPPRPVRQPAGRTADLAVKARMLAELVPARGDFPDFLTPTPVPPGAVPSTAPAFEEALESVHRLPVARLRAELEGVYRSRGRPRLWVRQLADGDREARHRLADALVCYQRELLEPQAEQITATVRADRSRRGGDLADGGVETLLRGLPAPIRWSPPVLETDYPNDRDLYLNGRGLLLVPSFFCSVHPVSLIDPELPPVLVYPACGPSGEAADGPGGGLGPRRARWENLAALLGPTRASTVQVLTEPCSTSELARRLGTSAGTASKHATVLRNAGLVVSVRQGSTVLHRLSSVGDELFCAAGAPPGRATEDGWALRRLLGTLPCEE